MLSPSAWLASPLSLFIFYVRLAVKISVRKPVGNIAVRKPVGSSLDSIPEQFQSCSRILAASALPARFSGSRWASPTLCMLGLVCLKRQDQQVSMFISDYSLQLVFVSRSWASVLEINVFSPCPMGCRTASHGSLVVCCSGNRRSTCT